MIKALLASGGLGFIAIPAIAILGALGVGGSALACLETAGAGSVLAADALEQIGGEFMRAVALMQWGSGQGSNSGCNRSRLASSLAWRSTSDSHKVTKTICACLKRRQQVARNVDT